MNQQQILQAAANAQPVRRLNVVQRSEYADPFNLQYPVDNANVQQHVSPGLTKLEWMSCHIACQMTDGPSGYLGNEISEEEIALLSVGLAKAILKRCDEVQRGRTPEP